MLKEVARCLRRDYEKVLVNREWQAIIYQKEKLPGTSLRVWTASVWLRKGYRNVGDSLNNTKRN